MAKSKRITFLITLPFTKATKEVEGWHYRVTVGHYVVDIARHMAHDNEGNPLRYWMVSHVTSGRPLFKMASFSSSVPDAMANYVAQRGEEVVLTELAGYAKINPPVFL